MCHATNASQFPCVGRALKLHGQPYAQLQLWMYSASKFHRSARERSPPANGIATRLVNRMSGTIYPFADLTIGNLTVPTS